MPELPEVETTVRKLRRRIVGRRIVAFESRWARQVSPSVAAVRRALAGRTIGTVRRRGKYVAMRLDRSGAVGSERPRSPNGEPPRPRGRTRRTPGDVDCGWLLVHLRMSGRFEWSQAVDGGRFEWSQAGDREGARRGRRLPANNGRFRDLEPPHVRAVWRFEDGQRLYFCDARKFGRIELIDDLASLDGRLGVEPRSRAFTPARLAGILGAGAAESSAPGCTGRRLKPLLLDQTRIAGLGNIYTDEALYRAGLHPLTPSGRLDEAQISRLHAAIREVLAEGIRRNGASIDWVYPGGTMQDTFQVYGRTGEPCRHCGERIIYLKVAQRGTHICPRCQEEQKATEDTEYSEKETVRRPRIASSAGPTSSF